KTSIALFAGSSQRKSPSAQNTATASRESLQPSRFQFPRNGVALSAFMKNLPSPEIWFITGSQHLYGEEALKKVAANSQKIAAELNATKKLPLKLVFKPILTRPEEIRALCLEATGAANCAGLVLGMHTFSPC